MLQHLECCCVHTESIILHHLAITTGQQQKQHGVICVAQHEALMHMMRNPTPSMLHTHNPLSHVVLPCQ